MKYLIVTNHSYMLWQFRRELIARLQKDGEVVISTPFVGHEKDFMEMGCRCVDTKLERRGMNPLKDFRLYRFYKALIKKEKPDLVITYSIKPNVYAGYACRKAGIPYCVNVQGLGTAFQTKLMAAFAKRLYKTGLQDARTVFFENKANASLFVKEKIIPRDKVVILPGAGVNLGHFAYQPYPDEERGIHFLYLGRIMKEKGIDELFSAIRALRQEFGNKVVLDVVGFFENEADGYHEEIDTLALEGTVRFHGFQIDPRPYYAMCHCVVLPSYHEGMSNVLLEAAATGRALITSDIPGCKEAVQDGITGLLCKDKDSKDLLGHMREFVGFSRENREQMGKAGRTFMKKVYDRSMVIEKTVESLMES